MMRDGLGGDSAAILGRLCEGLVDGEGMLHLSGVWMRAEDRYFVLTQGFHVEFRGCCVEYLA